MIQGDWFNRRGRGPHESPRITSAFVESSSINMGLTQTASIDRYLSAHLRSSQKPRCRSRPSLFFHRQNFSAILTIMATEQITIVPTERELNHFQLNDPTTIELITRAQTSYEADHKLTIRQAIKKHKTAVFWALILSFALVMESYDVVVVSPTPSFCQHPPLSTNETLLTELRSTLSSVKPNSASVSARPRIQRRDKRSLLHHGSQA